MPNKYKSTGQPAECLQPIPLHSCKPLERITTDILGPLLNSNNKKYLLVFTCQSSKYVLAKATKASDANKIYIDKHKNNYKSTKKFTLYYKTYMNI
jgi:hypothetical protein